MASTEPILAAMYTPAYFAPDSDASARLLAEAKVKMSQNLPDGVSRGVVTGLVQEGRPDAAATTARQPCRHAA